MDTTKDIAELGPPEVEARIRAEEEDIYIHEDQKRAFYIGQVIATAADRDKLLVVVAAWMREHNYFPNVWQQDDHGGLELITEDD